MLYLDYLKPFVQSFASFSEKKKTFRLGRTKAIDFGFLETKVKYPFKSSTLGGPQGPKRCSSEKRFYIDCTGKLLHSAYMYKLLFVNSLYLDFEVS